MCSSKTKSAEGVDIASAPVVQQINGRPVLQPTCNRVPTLERRNSVKKTPPKSPLSLPQPLPASSTSARTKAYLTPPISPKSRSPRPPAVKRLNNANGLSLDLSSDKIVIPKSTTVKGPILDRKKSKSFSNISGYGVNGISSTPSSNDPSFSYSSSLILEAPGSIAAGRREQMVLQQAQRKMRTSHYGRSKSSKFEAKVVPVDSSSPETSTKLVEEEKRCSFITANSDPIYVAYHDEEWGVPVHDDKMLFELLVLSGAQVGSDWTSILKKRNDFRNAFSGFVAETLATFADKQMNSVSAEYSIEISRVRGVVNNALRILEIKKEFSSFDKYIWGFVNHKPIATQYKYGYKIPVKTSKSDCISKDMIRRGFRFVGPTMVHSFMQAAGLTNDHLITCHRHQPCTTMAAPTTAAT